MTTTDRPLTKRHCDDAKPKRRSDGTARENTIPDGGRGSVNGFGLRVSPAGAKSFVLMYRAGKGRAAPLRKVTIGAYGSPWTVETARREAQRLRGIVAAGGDPAGERATQRAAVLSGPTDK